MLANLPQVGSKSNRKLRALYACPIGRDPAYVVRADREQGESR
jgi:hypothetical protein